MKLKYLKSIQYISYVILIENFFVLTIDNTGGIGGYTFVWIMMISLLLCNDNCKTKLVQTILSVFLFSPVLFQNNVINCTMTTVACTIMMCLRKNVNKKTIYEQISYPMKILMPLAIGILLLAYLEPGKQEINEFIMPYVIMYIIISIIILRIMRDFKYDALNKRTLRVRTVYVTLFMILLAVFSMEQVRTGIIKILDLSFSFLGSVLYSFEIKIINFCGDILRKLWINVDTSKLNYVEMSMGDNGLEKVETSDGLFWKMEGVFRGAYIAMGIIIVVLLLYSFLRLYYTKRKKRSDFIETREHIYKRESIADKKNKKLYLKLKKGNYKDQIRYYYYRYLKDCKKKSVAVRVSDTTYEINKKAQIAFNQQSLEQMRKIYIKAKYTNRDCTVSDFEEFHKNYKEK